MTPITNRGGYQYFGMEAEAVMDKTLFRSAMAQLGAAVSIITTDGPGGLFGITASAVCSVSDEPASLLVCINRQSPLNAAISENGVLAVNVLGGDHENLSGIFATRGIEPEQRFAHGEWRRFGNGVPALADALVSFACRVDVVQEAGTHGVFICHVEEAVMRGTGEGLMYFDRAYHRVPLKVA